MRALLSKFWLFVQRPWSSRIEKKSLSEMTCGIGVVGGEMPVAMLRNCIEQVRISLGERQVTCVDILPVQAKWLRQPLNRHGQRDGYYNYSTEKWPEAQFYVVFSIEGETKNKVVFSIYGAAFELLFEADTLLINAMLFEGLQGYIREKLGAHLTVIRHKYPLAFDKSMSFVPNPEAISKVFTLPPNW